jgi:hypothetical protein
LSARATAIIVPERIVSLMPAPFTDSFIRIALYG